MESQNLENRTASNDPASNVPGPAGDPVQGPEGGSERRPEADRGRGLSLGVLADDIADLVRIVEDLRIERDHDRALLDELIAQLAAGVTSGAADGHAALTELAYKTWTDWVDEWLVPRIDRSPHRYRWCLQYANHPEVADRLEALWHTWETTWPNPQLRSAWYRDHLDHHWVQITDECGPMRDCPCVPDE